MAADFGLTAFKMSPLGKRIEPIVTDGENVRDMVALCRNDLPAVRAIGKQLLQVGIKPKDDEAKKHIGRWVREVMGGIGWLPVRKGKIPRGNLFSTGAIYRPRSN